MVLDTRFYWYDIATAAFGYHSSNASFKCLLKGSVQWYITYALICLFGYTVHKAIFLIILLWWIFKIFSHKSYFHNITWRHNEFRKIITMHYNGRRPLCYLIMGLVINRYTINLSSVFKYFCVNKYMMKRACQNDCWD